MVLDRLRVLSLADSDHLRVLLQDHRAIAAAIRARDIPAALERLERHTARVLTTLDGLEGRNKEFFE